MSVDNVYSFTVQRQNSADVPPGKSPCVKIKFIKDETVPSNSLKFKIGNDETQCEASNNSPLSISNEVKLESQLGGSNPLQITQIHAPDGVVEYMRRLLPHLHSLIEKKDTSGIFALPVVEEHAPKYHDIISNAMDLRTIRLKISDGTYRSVAQMLDDIILMLHNALIYNEPDTVYHRIAAQILNFTKKSFSKESLNKFIQSKLAWPRALTNEESGDIAASLHRINFIQGELMKSRPNRIVHRNTRLGSPSRKRKHRSTSHSSETPKRWCTRGGGLDLHALHDRSGSEADGSSSRNCTTRSDGSLSEAEAEPVSNDPHAAAEVLRTARRAAEGAHLMLQKQARPRPVVYLDRRDGDVCLVDVSTGRSAAVGADVTSMVGSLAGVNLEQLLGDCGAGASLVHQLCYDSNECVTITTSKPLEPYSYAEQAVLVETFGNVITAEYACNMHNYVLDLPADSAAVDLVRSRLNAATNYLTYGVDQIITKKLRAHRK